MSGRCDHSITSMGVNAWAKFDKCLDCGDYLPFGPATMTADVEVEIAAAAMAAAHANRYLWHTQHRSDCMACGWNGARFDADYQPETTAHVVGWLARVIATHDDGAP